MKKGAMFGLDARIALAIFGALSVISGASLYSAIKDSKVTSLLADAKELAKAYEQYYLDIGVHLPNIDVINLNAAFLVDGALAVPVGWKGPYISYQPSTHSGFTGNVAMLRNSNKIFFTQAKGTVWPAPIAGAGAGAGAQCSVATDCYVYVRMDSIDLELVKALDLKIDGVSNNLDGIIRYETSGNVAYLYYKAMPKKDI